MFWKTEAYSGPVKTWTKVRLLGRDEEVRVDGFGLAEKSNNADNEFIEFCILVVPALVGVEKRRSESVLGEIMVLIKEFKTLILEVGF